MLRTPLVRLVDWCARHAWRVIVLALALAVFSGVYDARQFAIKTDINDLFPPSLSWTARALGFMKTFPQHDLLVVVDAPTSEFADAATAKLTEALAADKDHFTTALSPRGGQFFAQNGLLFMPTDDLAKTSQGMQKASPVIAALAADPTLRGALGALNYGVIGVA